MIDADREEFLELLGDLFGAHSRNVNAQVAGGYWKGLQRMTLAEFRASVERDLEKLQHAERGVSRPPTVAELWDLKRAASRANPEHGAAANETPAYHGDGWSVNGNLLLVGHIWANNRKAEHERIDYAPDSYYDGSSRTVKSGEHTEAIGKILAEWKNAWVRDKREAEADGRQLDGRKSWEHCIGEADRLVREYLARYVTRQAAA